MNKTYHIMQNDASSSNIAFCHMSVTQKADHRKSFVMNVKRHLFSHGLDTENKLSGNTD